MAEIGTATLDDVTSQTEQPKENSQASDFDPKTMRKTKPGLKRLILTLTVLLSFSDCCLLFRLLTGLPLLLKSIEIYRSQLPFHDIDSLSHEIESTPLSFPCKFHAVFANFDHSASTKSNADNLGFHLLIIRKNLLAVIQFVAPVATISLSVTLDSITADCVDSQIGDATRFWRCGAMKEFKFDDDMSNDVDFDEYLESVTGRDGGKVYTIVVVNTGDGLRVRAVVGKHRHGWIVGGSLEVDAVVERVAEMFVKVFVNGGKEEGSVHGEYMPVGADGRIVVSFNLLNADLSDWVYNWDFQEIDDNILAPIIEALGPLANISVESQVLCHTPKSSFSYWDGEQESYIFSTKDLPFFVNSNEWHLDTSIAASGRSKILHFVVYVPAAKECPLLLQLPNGDTSMTNGFISPMWGGVVVWNPPSCLGGSDSTSRHIISLEEVKKMFEGLVGQFRQLFGLKSDSNIKGASGTTFLLASERGFTEWEIDVLSRQHTCFNLLQCDTTLGSLSRLVQSLPRMIIKDEIGKQVKFSLEAGNLAQSKASQGVYDASAVFSRQARSLAEDAFFHPSIMSISYYSFEHCFAVYSPFFLPVSLHVLLAAVREWKRYKQESRKYTAWKAKGR